MSFTDLKNFLLSFYVINVSLKHQIYPVGANTDASLMETKLIYPQNNRIQEKRNELTSKTAVIEQIQHYTMHTNWIK